MTRKSFLIATGAAIIIYFLIIGVWGEQGMLAKREMQEMLPDFQQFLEQAKEIHEDLEIEKKRLESDYQRILEEAYAYGYIQDNEYRVLFEYVTENQNELSKDLAVSAQNFSTTRRVPLNNTWAAVLAAAAGIIIAAGISRLQRYRKNRGKSSRKR